MNGYKIIAETYRRSKQGEVAKVYDYLAACSMEDFSILFDSGAFNQIVCSYIERASRELIEEGTLNKDQGQAILNRCRLLLDEVAAKEIC